MTYFISQESDQGFHVEPDLFVRKLQAYWPGASVRATSEPDDKYLYEWTLQTKAGELDGLLKKHYGSVALDGSLASAAAFAVWFQREIAGHDENLKFYDENYDPVVSLNNATSEDDIVCHMERKVSPGR